MRKQVIIYLLFSLTVFLTPQLFSEQIKLSLDLEIKEPENIIFYGLGDIATDSKNNIYILDRQEKSVYLFNEEGKFLKKIGRSGQGPGEFERPCSIYIDAKDIIYILDERNRRVEIFDSDASYIKSTKIINFPTGSGHHIIVDKSGNFYISGCYRFQNSAIAKFSPAGEQLKHFSLPLIEYEGIEFDEHGQIMANQQLCGGSMCFDDEERLCFSYKWPHLIKILTHEGKELLQFSKVSQLNWTPCIFKTDQINGMLFGAFTHSVKLIILDNDLVNIIHAVDWEGNPRKKIQMSVFKSNPEKYLEFNKIFAVLEFYTKKGELLASTEIDEKIYFKASDKKGRLLAIKRDEEDMQSIVRYRVELSRNK